MKPEKKKERKPEDQLYNKKEDVQEKERLKTTENETQEDSRNGILPEDMDFRKFIGCGG